MYDRYANEYQDYIVGQLAARGFDPATSSKRFAQSLDIVLGKKQIYLQQPNYYYFPGLPQIQFYERAPFPWLAAIERETDAIRAELQAVMQQPAAFAPYVQGHRNRPPNEQAGMLNNPAWSAFYLWKNGEVVAENAARCPKTMQALQDAPLAHVPNRSPSILFSLLQPGAHIPPHNGLVNTRLICHLPLIVPGQCRSASAMSCATGARARPGRSMTRSSMRPGIAAPPPASSCCSTSGVRSFQKKSALSSSRCSRRSTRTAAAASRIGRYR